MIKITTVPSIQESNNHLVLIAGGPGLSSNSIRGFDKLSKKIHLHYVDFPGMNGNPYDKDRSFEELSELVLYEVKKLSGNIYLLGHSFGGFFASDIALWGNVSGLICLGTPFSEKSLNGANENYNKKLTAELKISDDKFSKNPSDSNFAKWLSKYEGLYFSPHSLEEGQELMLNDSCSARAFLHNGKDLKKMSPMLKKLSEINIPKLFIAGKADGLLNMADLREDAEDGKFQFIALDNANHFMMLDQPEQVAGLIENFIATIREEMT